MSNSQPPTSARPAKLYSQPCAHTNKKRKERERKRHKRARGGKGGSAQGATTQAGVLYVFSGLSKKAATHTRRRQKREKKTTCNERCAPAQPRQTAKAAYGRTHSGGASRPGACVEAASRAARSLLTAATAESSSTWRLMARDGPALDASICFGRFGRGGQERAGGGAGGGRSGDQTKHMQQRRRSMCDQVAQQTACHGRPWRAYGVAICQ